MGNYTKQFVGTDAQTTPSTIVRRHRSDVTTSTNHRKGGLFMGGFGKRKPKPKHERLVFGDDDYLDDIKSEADIYDVDPDEIDERDIFDTTDPEKLEKRPPKHAASPAPQPEPKPEPKSAPRPAPKPAAKPAPSFAPRMATRTPTYPETDQQVVALFRSLQSKNVAYGAGIFVDDYGRLLPINLMSLSPEMLEIHEIIEEHYYAPAVRKNVAPFWSKLPGMSYAMSIQSILKAREDFGWNPGRLSLTDKNCHFYVLTSDGKVDLAATKERPVTDAEIEAWKNANLDLLAKLG